jgi:flagellar protein FlgJ
MTAQAILESYYGERTPKDIYSGKESYNLFGIKGVSENGYVECWTREWDPITKDYILIRTRFRAYFDYESSFADYVILISSSPRYKEALKCLNDPKRYIYELWKAGYATDPKYLDKILKLMDQVNSIPVILLKL